MPRHTTVGTVGVGVPFSPCRSADDQFERIAPTGSEFDSSRRYGRVRIASRLPRTERVAQWS